MQLTSGLDTSPIQREQSGTVAEATAAVTASLGLESILGWSGGVFRSIPLPAAFVLLAVMTLHSELYAGLHTSTISEVY